MDSLARELSFSYPVYLDMDMFNGAGDCHPAGYERIAIETVGEHLVNMGIDSTVIGARHGVAWVLLSLHLEIRKPFRVTDRLTVQTWHTAAQPPTFRRDVIIRNAAGEAAAVGATISTLADVRTHRICMNKAVLSSFDFEGGEPLLAVDKRFSTAAQFTEVERRTVRPSWIDGLGHVNNIRYCEFAYDALTEAERARMGSLSRMDIWFKSELREGAQFAMERAEEGDAVLLRGSLLPEMRPSFIVKLNFGGNDK